jgi:hypothetical protein
MKVIIRQTAVNCKTPFNADDEDGQKVVNTIRDSVMLINQAEALIEKTKSELKQYESDLEGAEQALASGKDTLVPCTLHIRHDENVVRIQRNDNKEWLPERAITDDDLQMESGDTEVEED